MPFSGNTDVTKYQRHLAAVQHGTSALVEEKNMVSQSGEHVGQGLIYNPK